MTDYELDSDAGVPSADGETWAEAAARLRGDRPRLHPLARAHQEGSE